MALIQTKIKELENGIAKIKSSNLYHEYLNTKQKLQSFENSKSQIKDEIEPYFTKISRPLTRYEYVSSLEKDQKLLLTNLINDPFEVLTPINRDSIIVILENVRKGIMAGSISVKDVDKTMMHLTEIEEMIDSMIGKVSEFFEKKKKIQDEIKSFDNSELSSLENQLERLYDQKNDAEAKISLYKKEISENSERLPEKIFRIENLLREFSHTKYTISNSSLN
jgi:predicted  nucleic acid-binding Zn-ribbon protein